MRIPEKKLKEIIESHGKRLRGEEGGNNADLRYADLRYAYISRIGSRKGITTYCIEDDNVTCGCWNEYKGGTLQEFKARVESVYGDKGITPNEKYYAEYMAAIKFFNEMRSRKND